ncbi:hypothetical protein Pan258_46220 [Symmachiella dynata]|uniref:hypothetical protein n=1 Tax=Symmachiella dynata TaxID=2527995 RepID=UPI00118BFD66|nr:hypothetical protein [Symmachiella dynata]QDT50543.1 hypothetical protein Pan258_46220 [Symmachiella dynata]
MASDKATLKFKTQFHSWELNSLELPVEIRKEDSRLFTRTLTSKRIEVPAGSYFVSTRLPAGQQLEDFVTLQPGEIRVIELRPDKLDESPSENLEVQHFLRRAIGASNSQTETFGPDILSPNFKGVDPESFDVPYSGTRGLNTPQSSSTPVRIEFHWYSGNTLAEEPDIKEVSVQEWISQFTGPMNVEIPNEVKAERECVTCQLQQPGRPIVNVRIPISPSGNDPTISILVPEPEAPSFRVGIRLAHETADLLTRYLRRGMYSEAGESISSDTMTGEYLLRNKTTDPIAAAVGSYTILKIGKLDALHEWTANLMNLFKWLPDGAAIRGEHVARRGEHLEACRAFLLLEQRGLPIFTEGLSYALDRLRVYSSSFSAMPELSLEERESTKHLLKRLERFTPFVDFDRTYVTYTGIDSVNPGLKGLKKS